MPPLAAIFKYASLGSSLARDGRHGHLPDFCTPALFSTNDGHSHPLLHQHTCDNSISHHDHNGLTAAINLLS